MLWSDNWRAICSMSDESTNGSDILHRPALLRHFCDISANKKLFTYWSTNCTVMSVCLRDCWPGRWDHWRRRNGKGLPGRRQPHQQGLETSVIPNHALVSFSFSWLLAEPILDTWWVKINGHLLSAAELSQYAVYLWPKHEIMLCEILSELHRAVPVLGLSLYHFMLSSYCFGLEIFLS